MNAPTPQKRATHVAGGNPRTEKGCHSVNGYFTRRCQYTAMVVATFFASASDGRYVGPSTRAATANGRRSSDGQQQSNSPAEIDEKGPGRATFGSAGRPRIQQGTQALATEDSSREPEYASAQASSIPFGAGAGSQPWLRHLRGKRVVRRKRYPEELDDMARSLRVIQ